MWPFNKQKWVEITVQDLQKMSLDEKINIALEEYKRLDAVRQTQKVRNRKKDLNLALEFWWTAKGRKLPPLATPPLPDPELIVWKNSDGVVKGCGCSCPQ